MKYIIFSLFLGANCWADSVNTDDPNLVMPSQDKFEATAQPETCCSFKHISTNFCTGTPGQNGCIRPSGVNGDNNSDSTNTTQ